MYKKPTPLCACKYTEALLEWTNQQLELENTKLNATIKDIFRRLARVYAHFYSLHFDKILELEIDKEFNTCFKHFIYFINEHKLVDSVELAPLSQIISRI